MISGEDGAMRRLVEKILDVLPRGVPVELVSADSISIGPSRRDGLAPLAVFDLGFEGFEVLWPDPDESRPHRNTTDAVVRTRRIRQVPGIVCSAWRRIQEERKP